MSSQRILQTRDRAHYKPIPTRIPQNPAQTGALAQKIEGTYMDFHDVEEPLLLPRHSLKLPSPSLPWWINYGLAHNQPYFKGL